MRTCWRIVVQCMHLLALSLVSRKRELGVATRSADEMMTLRIRNSHDT